MINICILDDYPIVHFGLNLFFNEIPNHKVIKNTNDFEVLKHFLSKRKVDFVVFDIDLQKNISFSDVENLVAEFQKTTFIIYTNLAVVNYAKAYKKIGVHYFISKKMPLETFYEAFKNKIEITIQNAVSKKIRLKSQYKPKPFKKLSVRELEVLQLLAKGFKNIEIANHLAIDSITVSTYKKRILDKLQETNTIDLILKAKKLDLV